jgi:outer membrane protein OmpA-like peptidoglycan-associated protein
MTPLRRALHPSWTPLRRALHPSWTPLRRALRPPTTPARRGVRRNTAAGVAATVAAAGLGVVGLAPARATVPACSTEGLAVTALHGPNFYIDSDETPALLGAYAGYRVTNSGSTRSDLWVRLADFGGGAVGLGSGQAASQQIPALAGSGTTSLFWYLTASGPSTTTQTHGVEIWQGRPDLPGSSRLCAESGGFAKVAETIKAAANKLTSVSVSAGTPHLGATFTITVQGETGTIGSGPNDNSDQQSFWMSPAATASWPADAYRLVGTSLTLGGTTYSDILRKDLLSSPNKVYTAVYTFRAIGFTASATDVVPVQQIASGTQIKHTDLGSVGSLPAISPATNDLTLAKTADVGALPSGGGTVHYTVTVSGTSGTALDAFEDTVPAGSTLVTGSASWRGTTIPDGVAAGGTLTFTGPFTVGASNNLLEYDLVLPAVGGDRSNSVVATVGSATIDATTSLTDADPPSAVVHVNEAPVATDDTASVTTANATDLAVLDNDTDPEDDTLAIDAVSTPAHGSATVNGTRVRYTSAGSYVGADQFSYTVSDGNGGTDTATVDVTVSAPVTLAPADDTATATSGVGQDVDVLGNDAGNPPMTVSAVGTASHGSVTITGGGAGVRYTSSGGYTGSDSFSYDVTDALGGTATATVDVTVSAPSGGADPVDDTATVDYDSSVLVDVLDNDPDGAVLDGVGSAPGHGSATVEGGAIRYTPDGDHAGPESFSYTVTGSSVPATVSVEVTPPELAVDDDEAVAPLAATPVTVDVLANDTGAELAVTGVSTPTSGTAVATTGGVELTPAAGFRGDDSFTYTVTDAVGNTATATVTVEVPNAAPTIAAPAARRLLAGAAVTSTLAVADDDPDDDPAVTAGTPAGSSGAGTAVTTTIGSAGGTPTVRVAAAIRFSGLATIPLEVGDGRGGTGTATLRVTVVPRAPLGLSAGVIPNPAARAAIIDPHFDADGRPVSRRLSTRIDSRITWRVSPTTSVTGYLVSVNGTVVCSPAASPLATTQSCTLPGRALTTADVVTVTALGAANTRSSAAVVPILAASATPHLLAVVYFPVGDFRLDATARGVLAGVDAMAVEYRLRAVKLVGHTDSDGSLAANQLLSRRRADQVGAWLTDRDGRVVVTSAGFGETRPALPNGTARGKSANRRVELWVGP